MVAFAGLLALGEILVAGASDTGETARAPLSIYPYLLLLLAGGRRDLLRATLLWAAAQTNAVQLFGCYPW